MTWYFYDLKPVNSLQKKHGFFQLFLKMHMDEFAFCIFILCHNV